MGAEIGRKSLFRALADALQSRDVTLLQSTVRQDDIAPVLDIGGHASWSAADYQFAASGAVSIAGLTSFAITLADKTGSRDENDPKQANVIVSTRGKTSRVMHGFVELQYLVAGATADDDQFIGFRVTQMTETGTQMHLGEALRAHCIRSGRERYDFCFWGSGNNFNAVSNAPSVWNGLSGWAGLLLPMQRLRVEVFRHSGAWPAGTVMLANAGFLQVPEGLAVPY